MVAGYVPVAFRDSYGISTLIFGNRDNDSTEWVVASESVAITALGFEVVRDVKPGECIFIPTQVTYSPSNVLAKTIHHVYSSMFISQDRIL